MASKEKKTHSKSSNESPAYTKAQRIQKTAERAFEIAVNAFPVPSPYEAAADHRQERLRLITYRAILENMLMGLPRSTFLPDE